MYYNNLISGPIVCFASIRTKLLPFTTYCINFSTKVPYGVKQSLSYKQNKLQKRLALEAARKQRETRGMILDTRKSLFMCLRHNTGINWFRAKEILKHLEMHVRYPSQDITPALKDKITAVANLVKSKK